MYSGTTFRDKSGRIMGVHQKIDRVARKHLSVVMPDWAWFPEVRNILHFEGKNGPDGIKTKSPAVDEPWHFIDPDDPTDTSLIDMVEEHIANLSFALKSNDVQRASFEASWMAHAVTDGLTPAHHYPYEQRLQQLRGGQGIETRDTFVKKTLMTGDTKLQTIRNNWKQWGTKGIGTTHFSFELGVASVVSYKRFSSALPKTEDIDFVRKNGYRYALYVYVQQVSALKMFDNFTKTGWTADLAKQVNQELMPIIIKAVVLGWLEAIYMSQGDDK